MKIARFLSLVCAVLFVCQFAHAAETLNEKLGNLFDNFGRGSVEDTEFLDPDEAFIFSADVIDAHHLKLRWEIADGYYLYRDRFGFSIADQGVSSGELFFPAGKNKKDPEFGEVEVYFHGVDILLSLVRHNLGEIPANLSVVYQGCKDGEICYPPIKKSVPVLLPATTVSTVETLSETISGGISIAPMIAAQDAISESLKKDNVLINMLVFLGFGLLLAFTPCIFPMIPILSGIIVGQGNGITSRLAFLLSSSYVIAMALMYAVLGIIAGSFQFNLQAASQNAWVITVFSLVFVLLAFSMFGFYEFQLPASWQEKLTSLSNRQKRGSLLGAAAMGLLSAVIVGPCVAPPLAGALIYISQTGDALLGGGALFALGLGMGIPLIIIGTSAGKLLPRAGDWMITIKKIFGVVMLGVAAWFMGRILPGQITLLLWGGLLISTSIYMGVFDRLESSATWKRLWKGVGIVFLIYGVTLIIGAAGGGQDVLKPLQGVVYQSDKSDRLPFKTIKSSDDLDRMLAEAEIQQQMVMLDFYADWCITCKEMERFTFPDPGVHDVLQNVLLLKADVTANDVIDQELMRRFDIIGPPAILFFIQGQERREYRLVGFVNAEDFIDHVRKASTL